MRLDMSVLGEVGMGEVDWAKIATGFTDIAKQAAPVVLAAKQQQQLQKLNIDRARNGLPALDMAQYAEASAPVVRVQGGVDAGTRKMMVIGGTLAVLVISGAVLMSSRKKGRR